MNNKGFTVVELLASFTLTMIIMVFLFEIVLQLKDIYVTGALKTKIYDKNAIVAATLNDKLANINSASCSIDTCAINGTPDYIKVDKTNKYIKIGDQTIKYPNNIDELEADFSVESFDNNSVNTSFVKIKYYVKSGYLNKMITFNFVRPYGVKNKTIFYVSSSGNDTTGTGSRDKPYKTIQKAYDDAATGENVTIYIMNNITVNSTINMNKNKNISIKSIDGETVKTIYRDSSFKANLINNASNMLSLTNIIINGNNIAADNSLIMNNTNGTLNIGSGTQLINSKLTNSSGGGAVYVTDNSTFTMSDGTISNNEAPYSGAIHIRGTASITGGNITNNKTNTYSGGAMEVYGKLIITGGNVKNNQSKTDGGGIKQFAGSDVSIGGTVNIENNTSTALKHYNYSLYDGNTTDMKANFKFTKANYRLASAKNNTFGVDVQGAAVANGTNVQSYTWNNSNAQKWKFIPAYVRNGIIYYWIQNQVDGTQYLWVSGNSANSGTNVVTWVVHTNQGGYWTLANASSGNYVFKSILGTCLDLSGGNAANSTNIQAYTCNSSDAQKWKPIVAN